jgi:pimeloyl-ACP methyl ester carboxylesterase
MKKDILLFGKTKSLVGILTEPAEVNNERPAVILLNAGLIHRVGPSRLYVKIAKTLAEMGFMSLRFDFSGTGDSRAREDHLPFIRSAIDEAQEAMNYLQETRGIERFLLIGHCSGAGFSFLTACEDPRVSAAILMNIQGQGEEWVEYDKQRKLSQYYVNYYGKAALFDTQKWSRFFRGDVDYLSIGRNVLQGMILNKVSALTFRFKQAPVPTPAAPQSAGEANDFEGSLSLLAARNVPLLLVYSEGSSGIDYVRTVFGKELERLLAAEKVKMEIIPESDHLFTLLESQKRLLEVIQDWTRTVVKLEGVEVN